MEKQPLSSWDRYVAAYEGESKGRMIYNAVGELQDPQEMRDFLVGYARWLEQSAEDPDVRNNALQVAGENIGIVIAQLMPPNEDIWLTSIEGLRRRYPDY